MRIQLCGVLTHYNVLSGISASGGLYYARCLEIPQTYKKQIHLWKLWKADKEIGKVSALRGCKPIVPWHVFSIILINIWCIFYANSFFFTKFAPNSHLAVARDV